MFGVIPIMIFWLLAFLFALGQRRKYKNLAYKATEPEEIGAYKKIVTRHTIRAVIYGLIFIFFLVLILRILTTS